MEIVWLCARFYTPVSYGVAEIAESTNLKGCPQIFVYIVYFCFRLLLLLLKSNRGYVPCVRCELYAHTLNRPGISDFVTSFLSVLLIQLTVGCSLNSPFPTGVWRLAPCHIVAWGKGYLAVYPCRHQLTKRERNVMTGSILGIV